MKGLKIGLTVTLMTGVILAFGLPQKAYAVEKLVMRDGEGSRKLERAIDADRDKIISESKAISEDRRKMRQALKAAGKEKAGQAKQEIEQDIKSREARIKEIKKEISGLKDQRNDILYGKERGIPKRRVDNK